MTDQPPSQNPFTGPKSAAAVGGVGAAVLAALGWLASELIDIEQRVERATNRVEIGQSNISKQLIRLDEDVDDLQDRMAVIESQIIDHGNRHNEIYDREREREGAYPP